MTTTSQSPKETGHSTPHRSKQTGGVGPSGGTKGGTLGLGHYVGTVEGKTEKDAFVLAEV